MKNKALEAEVVGLARRAGIDGGRVFEADMSRDTKSMDARVVGARNNRDPALVLPAGRRACLVHWSGGLVLRRYQRRFWLDCLDDIASLAADPAAHDCMVVDALAGGSRSHAP